MVRIINFLIQSAADVVIGLLNLLPSSPFQWVVAPLQSWLGVWNYFLPISEMVGEMELFVMAVSVWYLVRWILRFLRYIG